MKKRITIEEETILLDFYGEERKIDISSLLNMSRTVPYERGYTPTEIGAAMPVHMSARAVNQLLEKLGYQTKINDEWMPTKQGEPYALQGNLSIIKSNKGNFLKSTLLWKEPIIEQLKNQKGDVA